MTDKCFYRCLGNRARQINRDTEGETVNKLPAPPNQDPLRPLIRVALTIFRVFAYVQIKTLFYQVRSGLFSAHQRDVQCIEFVHELI